MTSFKTMLTSRGSVVAVSLLSLLLSAKGLADGSIVINSRTQPRMVSFSADSALSGQSGNGLFSAREQLDAVLADQFGLGIEDVDHEIDHARREVTITNPVNGVVEVLSFDELTQLAGGID